MTASEPPELHEMRCCVCQRVLGITRARVSGQLYCPDRTCLLYPPLTLRGRNTDHTLSTWVVGLVTMTATSAESISRATGHSAAWARHVVRDHIKRWRNIV